jgi:hypothetical protein
MSGYYSRIEKILGRAKRRADGMASAAPAAREPEPIDIDSEYDKYLEDDDNDADRMSFCASTGGASLASNVTRYRYENGRRYHSYRDGTYYAPNDEKYSHYETIVYVHPHNIHQPKC